MFNHQLCVLTALVATVACTTVSNAPQPDLVASLDEGDFHCVIEPILIRDCSYLACHGNAGSALRVYSVGKLRAGDSSTIDTRTAPLTDDERHANYLSAIAFSFPSVVPGNNFLVRKPLPAAAGGYEHKGGADFSGTDDPRVVNLISWLNGEPLDCAPAQGRHR